MEKFSLADHHDFFQEYALSLTLCLISQQAGAELGHS